MKTYYEEKKVELLTLLRKEMNGAVVDSMKTLDKSSNLLSYGVSVPTIKSICRSFEKSHGLSQHLFKSRVRELKLAAIYLDIESEITTSQIEEWSSNFGSIEIMFHLSKLFAQTDLTKPYIAEWLKSSDNILSSFALQIIAKNEKNSSEVDEYISLLTQNIDRLNSSTSSSFIAAAVTLYKHNPKIKNELEKLNDDAKEVADFLF